ncbi:CotH kinase family protein [Bacteroidota bacterium]
MKIDKLIILISLLGFLMIISCYKEIQIEGTEKINIPDWSDATHGNSTNPDYEMVFPENKVNRIDIRIDPGDWQLMLDDMTEKKGEFGKPDMSGPGLENQEDPVYVPCAFVFNGIEWYKVGVRFKGNSSLQTSWRMGIWKLPFKLNFDNFEDRFPQIKNQRFYGFQQLSLKNGFKDPSLMREKVVGDLLSDAGLAAAKTSFVRVYIDHGNGPVYFGLYTFVEDVDDTLLDNCFNNNTGNLYKPHHRGASFARANFNTTDFVKYSNEEEADWSDIISLFDVLHSNDRLTNSEAWKQDLENIFNVDIFLKWLAINTTIQNWDTYGLMNHNYYLYNNPSDGLLTWIPWDNNEGLIDNQGGGQRPLPFSFINVRNDWPLIRFLYDDPAYKQMYDSFIREFLDEIFIPSRMQQKYQEAFDLIEQYVVGPDGEQENYTMLRRNDEFYEALNYLKNHVEIRNIAAEKYLRR